MARIETLFNNASTLPSAFSAERETEFSSLFSPFGVAPHHPALYLAGTFIGFAVIRRSIQSEKSESFIHARGAQYHHSIARWPFLAEIKQARTNQKKEFSIMVCSKLKIDLPYYLKSHVLCIPIKEQAVPFIT